MAGDDKQDDPEANSTGGLGSESSSSDYNPFPHAGDDVAPDKEKAIVGDDDEDDEKEEAPDSGETSSVDDSDTEDVSDGSDGESGAEAEPSERTESDSTTGDQEATDDETSSESGSSTDDADDEESAKSKTKMGVGAVQTEDSDDEVGTESQSEVPAPSGPTSTDEDDEPARERADDSPTSEASADSSVPSPSGDDKDEKSDGPSDASASESSGVSDSSASSPASGKSGGSSRSSVPQPSDTTGASDTGEPDDSGKDDDSGTSLTSDADTYWGADDQSDQADEYHDEFFDPDSDGPEETEGDDATSDDGDEPSSTGSPGRRGPPGGDSGPPPGAGGGPPGGARSSPPERGSSGPPGGNGPTESSDGPDTGAPSPGHASTGDEKTFDDEELELDTEAHEPGSEFDPGSPEPETEEPGWGADAEFDRVEPGQFGASGFQKFANILLVAFIVGNGFLAVVAFQNSWFVDFANFRHMLEVAFQGAEYEPREEWTESDQPVRTVEPKEKVAFENVFAHVASIEDGDQRLLVMKGTATNETDEAIEDVEVRGLVYNREGKLVDEAQAPLGGDIPLPQIESLGSPDESGDLQPRQPASLDPDQEKPFTVVFSGVPKVVGEGKMVKYKVEVASPSSVAQ